MYFGHSVKRGEQRAGGKLGVEVVGKAGVEVGADRIRLGADPHQEVHREADRAAGGRHVRNEGDSVDNEENVERKTVLLFDCKEVHEAYELT